VGIDRSRGENHLDVGFPRDLFLFDEEQLVLANALSPKLIATSPEVLGKLGDSVARTDASVPATAILKLAAYPSL
jgi:hypothetical protein